VAQGTFSGDFSADFGPPVGVTVGNWPGNAAIDTVALATTANRETDALGDPGSGPALASVDPRCGLAVFGAQLAELVANLQLVLAEIAARTDLVSGWGGSGD
jgi:hypothetical protein